MRLVFQSFGIAIQDWKSPRGYVSLLEYGNEDLSGGLTKPGSRNNPAWIHSSKISLREQVLFSKNDLRKITPLS